MSTAQQGIPILNSDPDAVGIPALSANPTPAELAAYEAAAKAAGKSVPQAFNNLAPAPAPVLKTSWYQWSTDVKNTSQKLIIALTIYMSAVFGGIIATQYTVIHEGVPRRFLSFLYGFAWYPLSLFYAMIWPPHWHSILFPYKQGNFGMFTYAPIGARPPAPSTTLRVISAILLAFNVYVAAMLIQIRFFI